MQSPRGVATLSIGLATLGTLLVAFVLVLELESPSTPQALSQPTAMSAIVEAALEEETARGPDLVLLPDVKGYEEARLGRGQVIEVRDGGIGLPPDAYVEEGAFRAHCPAGPPCSTLPVIVVRRGNSTIAMSPPSGNLFLEEVAPGEEGAFDFPRDALTRDLLPLQAFPEYRGGVSTTVVGPKTFGSRIHIAGKDVQLPPDAYVEQLLHTILCVAGRVYPETPIYTIRRGDSTISFSSPSGKLIEKKVAPGEEGAFDFLKEALAP